MHSTTICNAVPILLFWKVSLFWVLLLMSDPDEAIKLSCLVRFLVFDYQMKHAEQKCLPEQEACSIRCKCDARAASIQYKRPCQIGRPRAGSLMREGDILWRILRSTSNTVNYLNRMRFSRGLVSPVLLHFNVSDSCIFALACITFQSDLLWIVYVQSMALL